MYPPKIAITVRREEAVKHATPQLAFWEALNCCFCPGGAKNLSFAAVMMMILLVWQPIGWISYKQSTV